MTLEATTHHGGLMTEERHRLLDICVKVTAALVTLIGIWIGYKQFLVQFELSNKRPFLELQAKYYVEMLETVSRITYPANDTDRQDSTRRFWQMYSGTSALVEDAAVEDKINSLSVCVKQIGGTCAQVDLEAHTLVLSQAIRVSLARSWGLSAKEN
jgi:hypothetical protein